MNQNEIMGIDENNVEQTVTKFDSLMHRDENGVPYWNAHDIGKALGYSQFQHFKPVIEKAKEQMVNTGINPDDHLTVNREMVQIGSSAVREVPGYRMDRRACYTVAMNADPAKGPTAEAKEYFLHKVGEAEKTAKIMSKLKDKAYVDNRDALRIENKCNNIEYMRRGVEADELSHIANKSEIGFTNKTVKELKKEHNVPENRTMQDFYGNEMCAFKTVAQIATRQQVINEDAHGVNQIGDIAYDEHRRMRETVQRLYHKNPEDLITGEDARKAKQRYEKLTKKQLKAIEQEF